MRRDDRFLSSTPGQIVTLLRHGSRTIEDLARELNLTGSGVRAQLAALERDGLISQSGVVRRGRGKPAFLYALTPDAENLLSQASEPVLRQLLGVLAEQLDPEELAALLGTVGRRLVAGRTPLAGDLRARLTAAIDVIGELGGLADLEERDGFYIVCCYSWPLSAAPDTPALCRMAEAMLAALVDQPISEYPSPSERPSCCFAIPLDAGAAETSAPAPESLQSAD